MRKRMKFGIFYEHQVPKPWEEGDELRVMEEAIVEAELADRLDKLLEI